MEIFIPPLDQLTGSAGVLSMYQQRKYPC